jgi:hypothetical protein
MDEYLPLFILLVTFIISAPAVSIVRGLANGLCRLIVGTDCFP